MDKNLEDYNVKKLIMQNEQLKQLLEDRKFVKIDIEFTDASIKLKPLSSSNDYLQLNIENLRINNKHYIKLKEAAL